MRDEGDELRRTNKLLLDELQASRDDNEKLKSELQTTLCLECLCIHSPLTLASAAEMRKILLNLGAPGAPQPEGGVHY